MKITRAFRRQFSLTLSEYQRQKLIISTVVPHRYEFVGHFINTIRSVSVESAHLETYNQHLGDCVILTHDSKILMHQRPLSTGRFSGNLNLFGGHIESGETVLQGLVRELHEELGAMVDPAEIQFIGALTEDFTNHSELVHVHFWHDRDNRIAGCYEGEAVTYNNVDDALKHPQIMDYARWALIECKRLMLVS